MRTSKIIELVVAMASVASMAMVSDARAAALGTATIDVRRLEVISTIRGRVESIPGR